MTATSAGTRTVIQNKGSDTLVNVAQAWAENYQTVDPDVVVPVSGGSGTGIAAMINGTADIANASRQMKQKEIDQAKTRGQDPVEHIVGYDALAVYLHPDNPLDSVSIARVRVARGQVVLEREDEELEAEDIAAGATGEAPPEARAEVRPPTGGAAGSPATDAHAKLAPSVVSVEIEDATTASDAPDRARSAAD